MVGIYPLIFLCLGHLCSSSKLNIYYSSYLFKVVSQPILIQTVASMIRSKIVVQFCRWIITTTSILYRAIKHGHELTMQDRILI